MLLYRLKMSHYLFMHVHSFLLLFRVITVIFVPSSYTR
jgi:hypothetical protein